MHYFAGVDVQKTKPCAVFVLDDSGEEVTAEWLDMEDPANSLLKFLKELHKPNLLISCGIDAPRMPMPSAREWFWSGDSWRKRKGSEAGLGRHCEVVVKALNFGNPQWTPTLDSSPDWMKTGYQLFSTIGQYYPVYEVFPSASYRILQNDLQTRVSISLFQFCRYPKDMLDACVAALTLREYIQGRGTALGGGDGLGTIVVPGKIAIDALEVQRYPK